MERGCNGDMSGPGYTVPACAQKPVIYRCSQPSRTLALCVCLDSDYFWNSVLLYRHPLLVIVVNLCSGFLGSCLDVKPIDFYYLFKNLKKDHTLYKFFQLIYYPVYYPLSKVPCLPPCKWSLLFSTL